MAQTDKGVTGSEAKEYVKLTTVKTDVRGEQDRTWKQPRSNPEIIDHFWVQISRACNFLVCVLNSSLILEA